MQIFPILCSSDCYAKVANWPLFSVLWWHIKCFPQIQMINQAMYSYFTITTKGGARIGNRHLHFFTWLRIPHHWDREWSDNKALLRWLHVKNRSTLLSVSHLTLEYPSLRSCILFWLWCLEVSFSFCLSINFVFICFIYTLPYTACFVSSLFNLLPCLLNFSTFTPSPFFLCTSGNPYCIQFLLLRQQVLSSFILMYIAYTISLKLW